MVLRESPHGRHELKFLTSYAEYLVLKSRVSAVMDYDKNAGENGYFIRSVYFDDLKESAYYEKLWGICDRRKYRVRAYNNSPNYISLECKEKHDKWVDKYSAVIDKDTCNALIKGDFSVIEKRNENVCRDMYLAFREKGLKRSVIVDYQREAFIFPASNLRITFDKNLHAGGISDFSMFTTDEDNEVTIPVYRNNSVILEIKYDNYIPDIVRSLMPGFMGAQLSISKYCLCKHIAKSIKL